MKQIILLISINKSLQREGASPETLDDVNSLIDYVVHSKQTNVNRTKPLKDVVRKKIEVPPTVLHKDENVVSYPFQIPPRYIRYIQTRVSVPGIKISENTVIHYNLYKEDRVFIETFNSRSSDLQISTVSHLYNLGQLISNEFLIIMDILEKTASQCNANKPFSYEFGLLMARENGVSVPAYILREVHTVSLHHSLKDILYTRFAHWVRRRNEFGLPLIRHLWPQTCPNDTSPLALFRPRAKDKMLLRRSRRTQAENIQYLYHLIDGFKRVLKILSKMRQRDEKKLILAELDIVLFDQRRNELVDPTYTCPFWNCILDIKKSKAVKRRKTNSICSDEGIPGRDMKLDYVERTVLGENVLDLPEPESYKTMRLTRRLGRGGRIWIDRFHINHNTSNSLNNSNSHTTTKDTNTNNTKESGTNANASETSDNTNTTADNTENAQMDKELKIKKEPVEQESDKEGVEDEVAINNNLDRALNLSNFDNFNIYSNETVLDTRPPFANPYEAGHVYNTLVLYYYHLICLLFLLTLVILVIYVMCRIIDVFDTWIHKEAVPGAELAGQHERAGLIKVISSAPQNNSIHSFA
ncbi:uncharacterized protein TA15345 [Theileria annulata]|uniref:Uncharacterized protein n=1 Tax=Theileria annulata TaxID=5874 RepID=Q4UFG1_THEAN|nr:uncharacterized protein TA15345 [Theileria annulata]CAI74155.1 hypothetical protein, conserved [Theileria annulata]|eukprot:XP_951887.1 hypothetical protein, conserved [Theileria annulata]